MNKQKGNILLPILLVGSIILSVAGIAFNKSTNPDYEKQIIKLQQENLLIKEDVKTSAELTSAKLGAFRPSNYVGKLLTRLNEGGVESTFQTTPGTARDGSTLTTTKTGDFLVFTVNPGASNEEKISASAVSVSGTTATWTIINRGLSFTENVAVTANKKQHAIGETVIISNDDHYLTVQYPAKDQDETITGQWTFTTLPITASTTYATETVAGSVELATSLEAAAGTSIGGTGNRLAIGANLVSSTASTTSNVIVSTDVNTGKIDGSFIDASTLDIGFGGGTDGNVTISATTTLTRDMFYDNLIINSALYTAGYRVFAKTSISGTGLIMATGTNGTAAVTFTPGIGGTATNGYVLGSAGGAGAPGVQNTDCVSGGTGSSTVAGVSFNSATTNRGGTDIGGTDGACGPISPGIAGTVSVTATSTQYGILYSDSVMLREISRATSTILWAGAGGSGGGSGTASCIGACNGTTGDTGAGGGGGSAGQTVLLASKLIAGTFSINAYGGNGGTGGAGTGSDGNDTTSTGGGGGGGGNGGSVIMIYGSKTYTGTVNVSGGTAGGAGANGGVAGTAGSSGLQINIPLTNLLR